MGPLSSRQHLLNVPTFNHLAYGLLLCSLPRCLLSIHSLLLLLLSPVMRPVLSRLIIKYLPAVVNVVPGAIIFYPVILKSFLHPPGVFIFVNSLIQVLNLLFLWLKIRFYYLQCSYFCFFLSLYDKALFDS